MSTPSLYTAFISHGGGPMPLLGDPAHASMVSSLQQLVQHMPKPSAIVVVSAHWEQSEPTVTTAARPALIYDYGGFPPAAYQIAYTAPGAPALAHQVQALLQTHGFDAQADAQRGFDHGMFVPLKLMYPEADIPCMQLSLCHDLDASRHLRMGQALQALGHAAQGLAGPLLLLGSGFSFHNMRAFFSAPTPADEALNEAFEQWLTHTCTRTDVSEAERSVLLQQWAQAPGARFCHPREEHLLPLHVCYGAAAGPAKKVWSFDILGRRASAYLW